MRFPKPNPRIGHLLERSSLCEFVGWSVESLRDDHLNHFSDYATKYRPELDLVLKDINVTVVRRGFVCYAIPANFEVFRPQRKRLAFAGGLGAGNLRPCSRCSASSRLPKAGSRLMG